MSLTLRALDTSDLPALRAIQHAQHDLRWSEGELHHQLHDAAHEGGRQVIVAERGAEVVGCAGWVVGLPWLFGAPVLAADAEAAAALIAALVERARGCGAARLRVSATAGEQGKRAALEAAGFVPSLAFLTVARPLTTGDGVLWNGAWPRLAFGELDLEPYRDVVNATFAGIPNTRPASLEEIRGDLERRETSRAATAAWVDGGGGYAAFTHVTTDRDDRGPFATVESIGVRAVHRRGGHAGRILDDVLARVAGEHGEARALIASTNAPSLGLFASRGFAELSRRTVYERS